MNEVDIIKDHITSLATGFCKKHLDEEYCKLSAKMIAKLARKRPSPILKGRPEIWAAAIIHSLGQMNFLYDKSFKPFVTFDELAEHFQTSKSTIGQKAQSIRAMLKLRHWDDEFSTKRMQDRNPFANLSVINVNGMRLIVPASNLNELMGD